MAVPNLAPAIRHDTGEWRRISSRAAETGAGIETASWNAAAGLCNRGYNLELVELGVRASDYLRGVCSDCWRPLPASGVCVTGCRRIASYRRPVMRY